MEIMTAEDARQKHNDTILNIIMADVQNQIDKFDPDFFIKIKKQYLTKYIREKLIYAGYEIKPNNDVSDFLSWFKKEGE